MKLLGSHWPSLELAGIPTCSYCITHFPLPPQKVLSQPIHRSKCSFSNLAVLRASERACDSIRENPLVRRPTDATGSSFRQFVAECRNHFRALGGTGRRFGAAGPVEGFRVNLHKQQAMLSHKIFSAPSPVRDLSFFSFLL